MSANLEPLLLQAEPGLMASSTSPSFSSSPVRDQPAAPRRVAGVRLSALFEIVAFVAIALAIDALWGAHNRYADLSPHPFWIVVVLAASYYGTHEGLAAVVVASLALLLGNLPQQQIDQDLNTWLLQATLQPLGWCVAAMVLGSMRDSFRRRHAALADELGEARQQLRTITDGYAQLHKLKQHLEARVAGQLCTVYALYNASRAIERQGVGEVLVGVNELVRTVMHPDKFSLFLLNGACLEAAANEGWQPADPYARDIEAASPLYEAVVSQRRFLVITDAADEPLLRGEGLLAGPLINGETGAVVGMLKIEAIGFLDLNLSNVQNFHVLCDWVGAALANAQRVENLLDIKGRLVDELAAVGLPAALHVDVAPLGAPEP